ncbi:hypothetical protein Tco_1028210 [Tanacetum coccineum]|uniref:Reverse transcriptase domain-containing protein n=1 Tax=Tanacetum coccineum TaxID=301880 RepID=A0ABQ5G0C2_9ASTR
MNFMVVRSPSPYNGIIGRPGVRKLQAVPSTTHGMLKILVEGGVITLKSSKLVPLECALVSGPEETSSATKPIIEERVKIAINPEYLEQTVMIGSTFTEEGRNKLCGLLQHNLDIFAWKPADMNGVPRHIAEHCLNVREGCSPVRQKKRGQAADRNQAIQEEVGKLVEAGIMKEIHYHDWLSNPVMVKSHIISNSRSQSGATKIWASVNFFLSILNTSIHSFKKLNGVSFSRRWAIGRAILEKSWINRR